MSLSKLSDFIFTTSKNIWKAGSELTPLRAFTIAVGIELGLLLIPYLGRRLGLGISNSSESEPFITMELAAKGLVDHERQRAINKVKPPELWNGISIFFPDPNPQSADSPTQRLIWFFKQAKFRIQLCIYLSSYVPIENVILEKIKEGVLVQVITDYDTSISHNNFNVNKWRQRGTEVKVKPNGHLMHNKFAIIDEQAVVTGSLNWTTQGITVNNENIIVSTDYRIVEKYLKEYDNIWASCDDMCGLRLKS